MHDVGRRRRKYFEITLIGMRHVHGDHQRTGETELGQPRERAQSMTVETLVDFPLRFVQVHCDRNLEFVGEPTHAHQRGIVHGVRCVRCKVRTDEWVAKIFVAQRQALLDVAVGTGRPASLRFDHDEPNAGPDMQLCGRACHDLWPEMHVGEAGDTAAQHFRDREFGAVAHVLRIDPATLDGPDRIGQPRAERHVLGPAAQQRHRAVRMGVDEPRQ